MRRQLFNVSILIALAALCLRAQSSSSALHYKADQMVSGTIRSWGNDQMKRLMSTWEEGFRKYQPGVSFETKLFGTGTAVAGLYGNVADLALMGRETTATEVMAFEWVFKYKPLGVEVATGSLDMPGKTFAVGAFVHKDNPITRLTLAQLDAIFGSEHRRGQRNIRNWGELGLTGEWKDQPIHPYGYDFETNTGAFFRNAIFNGSDKWNCDVEEFDEARITNALAQDRYGIAYSSLHYINPQVKMLALSEAERGPYYLPTKETLIARTYPLTRAARIYVNRVPGQPLDSKVREFLRYVLSWEGQQAVVAEGDFLQLNPAIIEAGLRKLDQ